MGWWLFGEGEDVGGGVKGGWGRGEGKKGEGEIGVGGDMVWKGRECGGGGSVWVAEVCVWCW